MVNFVFKIFKIKIAVVIYDVFLDYSKGFYKNFKEVFVKGGGKFVVEEVFLKGE